MVEEDQPPSAFEFNGQWREFLPIALTNLLLTLVTLGIYRFWAITRERRYFWNRTRFIEDRFDWTGTGLELFLGFITVALLLLVPLFGFSFLFQSLILNGQVGVAILLAILLYVFLFWLFGVAKFRTLRYRLSRSWWRGIRGGSDDRGFRYGLSFTWRMVVGYIPAGLLIPWAMVRLWNKRWRAMSFGGSNFQSAASAGNIFPRFLLCYAAVAVLVVALGASLPSAMTTANGVPQLGPTSIVLLFIIGFYIALPLASLVFYVGFLREAIGGLRLAGIDFTFTARTKDWLLLYLGNIGLWLLALTVAILLVILFAIFSVGTGVFSRNLGGTDLAGTIFNSAQLLIIVAFIVPFALVGPFIRYRSWRFGVRHMEASGEIDADALAQSRTRTAGQGEGLFDVLDVGAI